jgi:hypothetical protein
MYGMNNFPDEALNNYAMGYLKEEKNVRATASQVLESKIAKSVSETVSLTIQEMSLQDFNSMIQAANQKDEEAMEEIAEVENVESNEDVEN